MEPQNSLGLYISQDTATAVYLAAQGKKGNAANCFSVGVEKGEEQEQTDMQILAERIAQGCAERKWKFTEVSVALDCTMFMQHSVHSEFRDPKKIAATVKFDTEEALATDITSVALAFEIITSDETGAELTVFTAKRKILSDILSALQQHDLDPVTIEPDIVGLTRFIHKAGTPDEIHQPALFALLSRHCGYLMIPAAPTGDESRKARIFRTFLVGDKQDRATLLAREVLVSQALIQDTESSHGLRIFDCAGVVELQPLRQKLGIQVDMIDLCRAGGEALQEMDENANPIEIAIAYGTALTHSEKEHKVDFRNDFSPFLGKRLRLQKALKFAAVSVTVLLIAIGLLFQTELFKKNKDRYQVRSRFAIDYRDATLERLSSDVSVKEAVRKLGSLLRRIKAEKMGLDPGQKSISSNLTLVLTAFNTCAKETDLKISSLTITDENIIVSADVSSRQNRQTLFEALEKGGLDIVQQNYEFAAGRESFHITLRPNKVSEKT